MKKELPTGTILAIVGAVVVIVGAFFLIQWNTKDGQTSDDKKIEQMSIQQAKSEYGRYQNPGGQAGGPPTSGEGAAQAAAPEGKPSGGQ